MASFASVNMPCSPKSASSHACAAAPRAKAHAKTPAKATHGVRAKPKAKARSRTKAKNAARIRTAAAVATAATTQVAAELPPISGDVDCDSTQTLAQGRAGRCLPDAAPTASANPGTACFAALAASHSSRRLAPQVPFLSASAASAQALENPGVPNRKEKEELGSVIAGYGMCMDMAAPWRKQAYTPAVVSALDAYWREAQAILSELAGGKRTFGDAAKAIAENDKAYKAQLGAMDKDL